MAAERIPAPALVLGGTGLIPFVAATLLLLLGPVAWEGTAVAALQGYAAVILSFVGAVHWGLALGVTDQEHRQRLWYWSVVPALLAWVALLLPALPAVGLLLCGFGAQYAADRSACRLGLLPVWYQRLRRGLTATVMLCLLASLLAIAHI